VSVPQATIAENASRIARLLKLRGSRPRLPGGATEAVHKTLAGAADRPDAACYRELTHVRGHIQPGYKQNYLMCLILLDKLWLVPPGSRAEKDVLMAYRESFLLIDRPTWKERIHDDLMEKQWSSFPVVRRAAALLRENERVGAWELEELRKPSGFAEVRTGIARRVVFCRQQEHVGPLLDYLVEVLRGSAEQRGEEQQVAMGLLYELKDFPPEAVLKPLYRAYLRRYEEKEMRGYLMKALSGLGDAAVTEAEEAYRAETTAEGRKPHLNMLQKMISQSSLCGIRALGEVLKTAKGHDLRAAARALGVAATRLAARGEQDERAFRAREELFALGEQLADSGEEAHRELARELFSLKERKNVTRELIERIIDGSYRDEDRNTARLSGDHGASLVCEVLLDTNRTPVDRAVALKFLHRIFGVKHRPGLAEMLWQLYRHESAEVVRVAALHCLAELKLTPPEENADEVLFQESVKGSPTIQEAITACWNRLFPRVMPAAPPSRSPAPEAGQ
jgi:hypothetical protein